MSTHDVDERIVQMKFDNAHFEQNVSQTMSTLDKLKAALHFPDSDKAFQNIGLAAKNVDFSKLSSSVETISDRFSTLGIIGMTALQRLTNAAIDLGAKLLSTVAAPLQQIKTGGWNRALTIENSMFTMSGMIKDFEQQRERIDENINYGVKDTAYSYDSAAKAMAQLVASQVEFREGSSDMMNALRGISGVAAVTNSSYDDIANIFTSIAGNGKLMTMQLRQFSYRGINAAAVLGEQLGKTEQEIREMVHKGQIDFQTFADAMDSAFGEHAKDANKTFQGALNNIKAALSRTGQGFASSLQTYGRDILNAIRPNINAFNKAIQPLYDDFEKVMSKIAAAFTDVFGDGKTAKLNLMWVPDAIATIENMFLGLCGIMGEVRDVFNELFPASTFASLNEFFDKARSYSEAFKNAFGTIKEEIFGTTEEAEELNEAAEEVESTVEDLSEIIKQVIRGDFGNGQRRREELESLGYSYEKVQNGVNELLGCSYRYEIEEEKVAKAEEKVVDTEKELAKSKKQILTTDNKRTSALDKLRAIVTGMGSAIKIVGNAAKAAYDNVLKPAVPLFLGSLVNILVRISEGATHALEQIEKFDTFNGIFSLIASALSFALQRIKDFYDWLKNLDSAQRIVKDLKELWEKLEEAVFNAGDNIRQFSDRISNLPGVKRLTEAFDKLREILEEKLVGALTFIADELDALLSSDFSPLDSVSGVIDGIANALSFIVEKGVEFYDWISSLDSTKRIIEDIAELWERLKTAIGDAEDNITKFFDKVESLPGVQKLLDSLEELVDFIGDKFEGALTVVADIFDRLLDTDFSGFGDGFFNLLDNTSDKLSLFIGLFIGAADVASTGLSGVYDFVKKIADNIDWPQIFTLMWLLLKFRTMFNIGTLVGRLSKLGETLVMIPKNLAFVTGYASDAMFDMTRKMKSEALLNVATAIEKIAISLFLLSSLNGDQMVTAIAGVAAIVLMTMALYKFMWSATWNFTSAAGAVKQLRGEFSKWLHNISVSFETFLRGGTLIMIATATLEFAAAMIVLVKAFEYLKNLNLASNAKSLGDVIAAISLLAGIMAGAVASAVILSKYASNFSLSTGAAIVLLAVGISIIAKAMTKLSGITGAGPIVSALLGMATVVAALVSSAVLLTKYAGNFGPKMAISILLFSAGMLVMAKALASLSDVPLVSMGAGVLSLMVVLYGFVKIANTVSKAPLLRLAASMVVLSVALGLMAIPLKVLSSIKDPNALVGSVAALISLMVAFGMVATMSKNLLGAGAGLIGMSIGISILTLALRSMQDLHWVNIWEGLTVLAVVLAALVLFAKPLMFLGMVASEIAVAFIGFGVGLHILISAIAAFISISDVLVANAPKLAVAFLIVVAGIAAGIIAGKALMTLAGLTLIDSFLTAITASAPKLLTTIISFVTLALIFTAAALSGVLDKFVALVVAAIQAIADAIVQNADPIFNAVEQLLDAIIVFIGKAIIRLVENVAGLIPGVKGFCEKLDDELEQTYDRRKAERRGNDLAEGTADGIQNGTPQVTGAINGMYSGAGEALDKGNALLQQKGAEGGTNTSNAFSENLDFVNPLLNQSSEVESGFGEISPLLSSSGSLLGLDITSGFGEGLDLTSIVGGQLTGEGGLETMLSSEIPNVGSLGEQLGQSGATGFDSGFDLSTLVSDELVANVPESILSASDGTNEAMLGWADSSTEGLPEFFNGEGLEIGGTFGQGISDGLSASGSDESVFAYNDELFAGANQDAYTYGQEFVGNYSDGELSSLGIAQQSGLEVSKASVSGTTQGYNDMRKSGENAGRGYAKGVDNQRGTVKVAGMSLKNAASEGADGGYDKMYDAGRYAGEGFYDGMASWAGRIAAKAYSMVEDAVNAAKSAEDAASPSKATRQLGVWFDQGFILGLESLAGKVSDTAYDVTGGGVNAMQEAISRLSSIMDSDIDYEPTIRPVMDLTNVYDGVGYLSTAFDSTGGLMGTISANVNNSNDLRTLIANTNKIIRTLDRRNPITIDGKTVIGWIDTELGVL